MDTSEFAFGTQLIEDPALVHRYRQSNGKEQRHCKMA